jgi:hypothetical protein
LRDDPEAGVGKIAVLGERTNGEVDMTREAERALLDVVSPHTIKTMVATARLILEKTNHQAIPNQAATLSIGEIAHAMGYTAGKDRGIDPLITQRIASDLFLLNRVVTWAADGPYERQKRQRQSGWIAPLIVITAVHVEQEMFHGPVLRTIRRDAWSHLGRGAGQDRHPPGRPWLYGAGRGERHPSGVVLADRVPLSHDTVGLRHSARGLGHSLQLRS